MHYRLLGKTGLKISSIALGTVSLGVDYGIAAPGEFGRPSEAEVIRLLQGAADSGINLFDTAPAYGESERLLGRAIGRRPDCFIATKVSIPSEQDGSPLRGAKLQRAVQASLENSLRALKRDALDIAQVHNATPEVIARGEMAEALARAWRQGKVRFLGASVYGEEAALAAIGAGCFHLLQVAYNVLDQRMAGRVFPAAEKTGVGIVVRSIFLKGVLTAKAQWLPPELAGLRQAAERARDTLAGTWQSLPEMALRFGLSSSQVTTLLVGARTQAELGQALAAVEAGPLPAEAIARAPALALTDERLLNPSYWPVA